MCVLNINSYIYIYVNACLKYILHCILSPILQENSNSLWNRKIFNTIWQRKQKERKLEEEEEKIRILLKYIIK